jgi:hypothetical protein
MIGHTSVGPLRACVKVTDCRDPSFAGTLTCTKSLVMCVENVLPPCPNNSQQQIVSFVLVRTVRSSCIA